MWVFTKYFGVSLAVQSVVIALNVLTGFGDFFVAMVYEGVPALIILATGIPVPTIGGKIPDFFLLMIPATFYSLIIGLAAVMIGNLLRRK
jgi:hypothetical protein